MDADDVTSDVAGDDASTERVFQGARMPDPATMTVYTSRHEPWVQSVQLLGQLEHLAIRASAPAIGSRHPVSTPVMTTVVEPLCRDLDETGRHAVVTKLRYLANQQMVTIDEAAVLEDWTVTLTPAGRAYIHGVWHRSGDAMARRREAREDVLRWLYYKHLDGDRAPNIDDFYRTGWKWFFGTPYSPAEVDDATRWLKEQGYLGGTGVSGGGIPRPSITAAGELVIEQNRSVNEVAAASSTNLAPAAITIINSSNVNVASHSPGAAQTITLTGEHRRKLEQLADALEQGRAVLELDQPAEQELSVVIHELRETSATATPEAGRLRRLLDRAGEIAVSGGGSALGTGLVALARQIARAIGLG